jgi:hypothetical protein
MAWNEFVKSRKVSRSWAVSSGLFEFLSVVLSRPALARGAYVSYFSAMKARREQAFASLQRENCHHVQGS